MLIKDSKGKYELKVDTNRFIVYEKNIGSWNDEDFQRLHEEYVNNVFPLLGGREWIKCTDLTKYILSDITKNIANHVSLCVEHNLFGTIIIVNSEDIKMQINYSVIYSNLIFSPLAFNDSISAERWLNSHWI